MAVDPTLDHAAEANPSLASTDAGDPHPASKPIAASARDWYDSSFELRRGLWVIETDLDPAVTHGIVVRKRTHRGRRPDR
jgi:hypothetical protein